MNFKKLAVAAGLAFVAASSFAIDIDLGGAAAASTTLDAATTLADWADVALTNGDAAANAYNTAVIIQDQTDGTSTEAIAYIDQVQATGSFAYIYQGALLAPSVAYIQQNTTLNTVAVITQR